MTASNTDLNKQIYCPGLSASSISPDDIIKLYIHGKNATSVAHKHVTGYKDSLEDQIRALWESISRGEKAELDEFKIELVKKYFRSLAGEFSIMPSLGSVTLKTSLDKITNSLALEILPKLKKIDFEENKLKYQGEFKEFIIEVILPNLLTVELPFADKGVLTFMERDANLERMEHVITNESDMIRAISLVGYVNIRNKMMEGSFYDRRENKKYYNELMKHARTMLDSSEVKNQQSRNLLEKICAKYFTDRKEAKVPIYRNDIKQTIR
jgi:hypothetical protein